MKKVKKEYKPWESIRKPVPKPGRPMSTKKGKKGYDRKKLKKDELLKD